jgi:nicotinate-nucleotide adenylyltransferase
VRLAIFGGSFDPPHVGHLLAAEDAYEHLSLDRIALVPTSTQPLKTEGAAANAEHRVAMLRLLIAKDTRFELSTVEIERKGLSFTVDTLTHYAELYPSAERFLLLGADVLATFAQWREPKRIVQLARPVILERAGEIPTALPPWLRAGSITHLPTRRVDVSSTEIRERVRQGKSIRGFVTDGVAAYIERHDLYR